MTTFVKSASGKMIVILLAAALVICGAMSGYWLWYESNAKFCDASVELGTQTIDFSIFLTEFADPEKVQLETDLEALDLSCIGQHDIVLRQGDQEMTVKLNIVDTKAPVVEFQDILVPVDQELSASDFVVSADDLSPLTAEFIGDVEPADQLQDQYVSVVVRDSAGNSNMSVCTVRYEWIPRTLTWELGNELTKNDLLLNPERDEALLDQAQLAAINEGGLGTYTVISTSGDDTVTCQVTVMDTTGPVLRLQEAQIRKGQSVKVDAFIKSVSDYSGDVTLELVSEPDCNTYGAQTVTVRAADIHGNVTTQDTTLYVARDFSGPKFTGLTDVKLEKHTEFDFNEGVTCKDARDGEMTFTVDTSRVDTSKAGTYYAIYRAKDSCGNETIQRRKITINPDEEDTKALVAQIADSLPNDPEAIRDYVRKNIRYSSNWGGDDPTWFGFNRKHGNCYVHAMCLQDLLEYKGWETQLIWVTKPASYYESHYWLLIKIDGQWKHIDATPSTMHGKYSLMNDAQRYETLVRNGVQRDWDRTMWPACE